MLGLRIQAEWGPSFGTGVAPRFPADLQLSTPPETEPLEAAESRLHSFGWGRKGQDPGFGGFGLGT